jgi:hypothetical protein
VELGGRDVQWGAGVSDEYRTIREVGAAINTVRERIDDSSGELRTQIKLTAGGIQTQLKIMTAVFTGCVGIAAALAGFLYSKMFEIAGPVSRIPTIEDAAKALSGKIDGLGEKLERVNEAAIQIRSQLDDARAQITAIRGAVKADYTPLLNSNPVRSKSC